MNKMVYILCVLAGFSVSTVVAMTGADFVAIGTPVLGLAQTAMSMKQSNQQSKNAAGNSDKQIAANNQVAAKTIQAMEAPVSLPKVQGNYPLVDPFARPEYWSTRSTQYQVSMNAAATNSQIMNEKAVKAIDAEFQQTQAMMKAIGGVLEQAGGMMQTVGAKMEQEKKAGADKDKKDFLAKAGGMGTCTEDGQKNCIKYEKDDKGNLTGTLIDAEGNAGQSQSMTQAEADGVLAAQNKSKGTVDFEKKATEAGYTKNAAGQYVDKTGNVVTQSDLAKQVAETEKSQAAVNAEISKLEAEQRKQVDLLGSAKNFLAQQEKGTAVYNTAQTNVLTIEQKIITLEHDISAAKAKGASSSVQGNI